MDTQAITFINIFTRKFINDQNIRGIEIPIIQRDYAQGRETKEVTRLRERFVNVLFNALAGQPEEPVKLDFIYGNIINGKLIPLDGQQRLTTLFLLHWYIAKHERVVEQQYAFLKNFTYKTRFSSQHFCESLIQHTPDFNRESISSWIIDQNWFMYTWEKDPTIKSMLVMLDTIHSSFKESTGLWDKLQKPYISFYFLPLEDMGLTDNLYIKMNSRGKPLTEFEHFKAEFEKIIKEVSLDLYKEFTKKVDVDWVDMLWDYRGDDDITDDEFMRYYRFVTEMICYQNDIPVIENDFDLATLVYGKHNENALENLKFLYKSFDVWKELDNFDNFFDEVFSKHEFEQNKVTIYDDNTNLFKQCCDDYGLIANKKRKFTLNNVLLLFAALQYLLNKEEITKEHFSERIRIVRNLVMNSSDEVRETRMKALLGDVREIINEAKINLNTLGFNEIQKQEEIDKITWRQNNPALIEDMNHLEDHFLLQGSVAIIGLKDPDKFVSRANNFRNLFNQEIEYLLISKALLSIGDYAQLVSWRFLFGNKNSSSWRELFTKSKQKKYFERTQEILLKLLDSIKTDFTAYLEKLVADYLNDTETVNDWRYYFIKYPTMRKGNSGVFWWRNDPAREKQNQYEIIMMNTPLSLNGKHWDPFLYTLSVDDQFKDQVSIEEYGAPLIIIKTNRKVKCLNNRWEIYNNDDNEVLLKSIDIPQNNEIDAEDRIAYFKKEFNSISTI